MVNFSAWIFDGDSRSPALLVYFFLLILLFASPPVEHFDHIFVSVSIDFPSNSKGPPYIACYYSCADWDGPRHHLKDTSSEDIFTLEASAASELCKWIQADFDVYIPHGRYQVKPHSSSWFSAGCAVAIAHRNHFSFISTK